MRRFVIPDIHGCFLSLKHLIEQLSLQKDDELYFLGDYINKGPDSKGVMDYIRQLQHVYSVICLKGNHEQMLMDALKSDEKESQFLERGGRATIASFGLESVKQIPQAYFDWINNLPYYHYLPDYILVHAGFNFGLPNHLDDKQAMLTIRSFVVDLAKVEGKTVLHGHVPNTLELIRSNILNPNMEHLSLDNGCVYSDREGMGNLIAWEIESKLLYVQSNVDCS